MTELMVIYSNTEKLYLYQFHIACVKVNVGIVFNDKEHSWTPEKIRQHVAENLQETRRSILLFCFYLL